MRAAVNMYHEKAQQELQDNHWLAAFGANIVVRHTAQSVSSVKSSCSSLIETGKINNNRLDRGTVPITVMLFASVLGNKRKQSRLAEGGEEAFMRDCSHDVGSTIYSAAVLLWWADVTLAHLLFARLQGVGSHRNLLSSHTDRPRLLSTFYLYLLFCKPLTGVERKLETSATEISAVWQHHLISCKSSISEWVNTHPHCQKQPWKRGTNW